MILVGVRHVAVHHHWPRRHEEDGSATAVIVVVVIADHMVSAFVCFVGVEGGAWEAMVDLAGVMHGL